MLGVHSFAYDGAYQMSRRRDLLMLILLLFTGHVK